eukprot:m.12043 g.12043  ORF g.12043 m.12043 type:complete len:170 (-) comp5799_c0_seq2:1864-2373(-)
MMLKAVNALAFKTCIEPSCCIHAMQLLDEDEGVMPRVCLDKDCLACEHKEPKPSCFVCSIQRGIERMMPAMPHHHMDRSGQVTAPAPLQCVLQPGKKLGAFSLGTSLSDAIQQVKHDPVSFPSCTLIYDETVRSKHQTFVRSLSHYLCRYANRFVSVLEIARFYVQVVA